MSFIMKTPQDVRYKLAERAKIRRLGLNLSQEGLARRAGISTGTIKRFEKTGHISIDSILKIALVLDVIDEFDKVFKARSAAPASIDELIETPRMPQRGRIK